MPLVPADEAEKRIAAQQAKLAALDREIQNVEKSDPLARRIEQMEQEWNASGAWGAGAGDGSGELKGELESIRKQLNEKLAPLRTEVAKLRRPGLPRELPAAYAVREGAVTNAFVHVRGDPNEKGPVVPRRVPKVLEGKRPPEFAADGSGRFELARWIASADNPLTARVIVNRVWQHHFGKGLVSTPSNFRVRGDPPTHPELLDYLARQFIEGGWSLKKLH